MSNHPVSNTERSKIITEEVLWLKSFGWSNRHIALKLHLSESTVENHLKKAATPAA